MENKNLKPKKTKSYFIILYVVLGVLLVAVAAFAIRKPEESVDVPQNSSTDSEDYVEKWQEGIISYKGKDYKYNNELSVYLFMGIDIDGPVEEAEDYISGGQSDAMFLLIADREKETLSVVSINRNTMTRIETCYANGLKSGYEEAQICVQHGFGDGKKLSCERTVDAVTYLFYNQPIEGYLSINMGGIPALNDAIGGVEVTVLNDLSYPSKNVELKEGEIVTLNGNQAYAYLRGRDINDFDSATLRLRRQEQYITAYFEKVESMSDNSLNMLTTIYNTLSPYIVTNMDIVNVLDKVLEYDYSSDRMYTIPGETVMGEGFEEFHVDEEAFYELILEVFYKEVTQE